MNPIRFYKKYMHDIATAVDALKANKVKSFLTMLGIMFGVAAVISMLALEKVQKKKYLSRLNGLEPIILSSHHELRIRKIKSRMMRTKKKRSRKYP